MTALLIGPMRTFGVLHELAQDDGRQRFGAEFATGNRPAVERMAHAPLDERGDLFGLLQGDVEGRLADDGAAAVDEDGAGREHFAVAIGQRDRLAAIVQRGDGGKRGAQVDADEFARGGCHTLLLPTRKQGGRSASAWAVTDRRPVIVPSWPATIV